MGIFLIVFGIVGLVASGIYIWYRMRNLKKAEIKTIEKKELLLLVLGPSLAGLSGVCLNVGFGLAGAWSADAGHMACVIIGGLLFFASAYAIGPSAYLSVFYKPIVKEQKKYAIIIFFSTLALAIAAFILAGEGMAPYLSYPLPSGFAITGKGVVWMYPDVDVGSGLKISWYGVVILLGAVLAYKISDIRSRRRYGEKEGSLDSTFLIAFPCGILGARIWYVVGNWNVPGYGGKSFAQWCAEGKWYEIFAINHGGLTVLGGAVAGIIAGVLWFMFRKKKADVRFAMDVVLPTILLAQAIGRWGNFFNHEVYGNLCHMSDWPLLPTWIKYNMAVSWVDGAPNFAEVTKTIGDVTYSGNMYFPLFLVEGLLNFGGFIILSFVLPKIWRKGRALGCIGATYLVWYGIVRIIMEPMRDPNYNMGTNGMWSFWNAMIYIIAGGLLIVFFELYALYRKKKGWPVGRGDAVAVEASESSLDAEEEAKEETVEEPKKEEAPKKSNKQSALSAPKKLQGPKKEDDE